MDLSISIVSWNTRELLDQCLESVYDNTSGISFEVIVVDNASRDGSVEMVKEKYPQTRLIENDCNAGFSRANNQAYRVSTGRHFILLNSDTIVMDNALAEMVHWMNTNPKCGACGSLLLNQDGTLQPSWCKFPTAWSELRGYHDRRIDGEDLSMLSLSELEETEPFQVDWVGGAALMVSRAAVEKVGLMDEGYFMYCEETDWCWRIRKAGFDIYYIPQAQIIHLGGGSSKLIPYNTMLRMEKSRLRFLWRKNTAIKLAFAPIAMGIGLKTSARALIHAARARRRNKSR